MNYRVLIHDMAKDDIRRNAQWWADKHSRVQAEKIERSVSFSVLPTVLQKRG